MSLAGRICRLLLAAGAVACWSNHSRGAEPFVADAELRFANFSLAPDLASFAARDRRSDLPILTVGDHDDASCRCSSTLFAWGGEWPNLRDPDEPIATDRPDFTEASSTVGLKTLQVEMGYTYIFNNDDGVQEKTHSWGEPLFRYGTLADWFELRLAVFPTNQQVESGGASTSVSGAEDLYVGCKFALTPQREFLPEMALVPQARVPTGTSALTDEDVLPGMNWLYGWDITDSLSAAGSTQFNRAKDGDTGETYTEWAQSFTMGFGVTELCTLYTEWFAFFPSGADTQQTEHYLNGGFTYLATNDIQFDIRAGYGLNHAAEDYFLGTGVSIRFR